MNDDFNRNEKQFHFNQIKGSICELNIGDIFCNITLNVGHENTRQVNLLMKRNQFDNLIENCSIGDKVSARFYITSVKKNGRWYTNANMLSIDKD